MAGRRVTDEDRARALTNAIRRTKGNLHITRGQRKTIERSFRRREADTGRCESCNGLHSDCGDA